MRGATLRTCGPIALIVGTILSAVNQGDILAMGLGGGRVVAKICINYLVPYLTSSCGALLAVRRRVDRHAVLDG